MEENPGAADDDTEEDEDEDEDDLEPTEGSWGRRPAISRVSTWRTGLTPSGKPTRDQSSITIKSPTSFPQAVACLLRAPGLAFSVKSSALWHSDANNSQPRTLLSRQKSSVANNSLSEAILNFPQHPFVQTLGRQRHLGGNNTQSVMGLSHQQLLANLN